jgi:hypothetical protein
VARSLCSDKGSTRFALIRGWTVAATAILTAAIADAATEFAENSGWLADTLRDDHQEAVFPVLLFGVAVAVSLTLFVVLARVSPGDPLVLRMNDFRTRSIDVACAFCGSVLCILSMEGYEMRFGGISPFGSNSIVLSHSVALIVAFLVTGALINCVLGSAIRTASRASVVVVEFLVEFLRKLLRAIAPPQAVALSAFRLEVTHVPPGIAGGFRGFRAPPSSIRPHLRSTS